MKKQVKKAKMKVAKLPSKSFKDYKKEVDSITTGFRRKADHLEVVRHQQKRQTRMDFYSDFES